MPAQARTRATWPSASMLSMAALWSPFLAISRTASACSAGTKKHSGTPKSGKGMGWEGGEKNKGR